MIKDAGAVARYGPVAAHGVVEIITRGSNAVIGKKQADGTKTGSGTIKIMAVKPAPAKAAQPLSETLKDFDGLILLNGKEVSHKELMKLDGSSIATIDVIKDSTLLSLVGKKASGGIIKITTQQ